MLSKADLTLITIEDGAFIDGSCTVIDPQRLILRRGAFIGPEGLIDAGGGVEIGEAVRISYRCVILSNTHHISRSVWRRSVEGDRHRPVLIERGCWIGAAVTFYPGVTVREGCVINAGSVVVTSTEPNGLYRPPGAVRTRDLEIEDPATATGATLSGVAGTGPSARTHRNRNGVFGRWFSGSARRLPAEPR